METRSLKFVAEACAAELGRGSGEISLRRVCTDSRQAQAGDLFFAIKGERFDGHDFLNEVAARGVAAMVVEQKKIPAPLPDCGVLVVDDARAALGRLAAAYRREFDLPVIAVGGSNGKTTVKELMASVLRQKLATLWSEASFNNDIGVPLTLLRLEKIASGRRAGSGHESSGRTRAARENDSAEIWRDDQHRPRAFGIFWRRCRRGAGRRLARGTFAGGRQALCQR